MTSELAITLVHIILRIDGCCTTCAGEVTKTLMDKVPDTPWLALIAAVDPDTDVITYVLNPEELDL